MVDDDFRVAAVHIGFVEQVDRCSVVGVAHTAEAALRLADALHPDVVLMDLYLPDGDGLAVTKQLLSTPSPPAVIVISAATDADAVRLALQLGATHYLVKPFGFAALAERLAAIGAAHDELDQWPSEATQRDVSRVFALARQGEQQPFAPVPHDGLAPTLSLVLQTVATAGGSQSANAIAHAVGISRATAQRALAQLERTGLIRLELRYGATGRPEHRYVVVQL